MQHRLVIGGKAIHAAPHRHQRVFIDAKHLRVLLRAVIRHVVELLPNASKDGRSITHLSAGIAGLDAQTVQEAFRTRIATHETGQSFKGGHGRLGAGTGLRRGIAQRFDALDAGPRPLGCPVNLIQTIRDLGGKPDNAQRCAFHHRADLQNVRGNAFQHCFKLISASLIDIESQRNKEVFNRICVTAHWPLSIYLPGRRYPRACRGSH